MVAARIDELEGSTAMDAKDVVLTLLHRMPLSCDMKSPEPLDAYRLLWSEGESTTVEALVGESLMRDHVDPPSVLSKIP